MNEITLTNNYNVNDFNEIKTRFINKMKELNIDFQEKDEIALDIMINAFLNKDVDRYNNVLVLNAGCGMGKTVLIQEYVNYMLEKQGTQNYGAVIARERVEDILDMSMRNENYYPLYGFKKEDCVKGETEYNPNICRLCRVDNCRIKQNAEESKIHPVLVTTHKRIQLAENIEPLQTQLYTYTSFTENDKPITQKRNDLFIDENPEFYELGSVTLIDIDNFLNELNYTYRRDCKGKEKLIKYFTKYVNMIKELLVTDYEEYFDGFVRKFNYLEFTKHENDFKENYYGSYFSKCLDVLNVLKYGGKKTSNSKIIFPTFRALTGLPFNTMIFDATAELNMMYPDFKTSLIRIPETRLFNNANIYVNPSHNLSKNYFKTHENFNNNIIEQIRLSLDKHEKVLIVTFMEQEEEFKEILHDEIENGRILLAHVNATKGRNDLSEATCVFILYSLHKTDDYYTLAMANELSDVYGINPKDVIFKGEKNKWIPMVINQENKLEVCQPVYEFMYKDKAKDIVQEVFRCAIRKYNNKNTIDIHLFNTDENIVGNVVKMMKGVNVEVWNETNERRQSDKLDDYMNAVTKEFKDKEEHVISTKDFKDKYFIKDSSFKRYQKADEIKALYESLNIKRKGNFFVKEITA